MVYVMRDPLTNVLFAIFKDHMKAYDKKVDIEFKTGRIFKITREIH